MKFSFTYLSIYLVIYSFILSLFSAFINYYQNYIRHLKYNSWITLACNPSACLSFWLAVCRYVMLCLSACLLKESQAAVCHSAVYQVSQSRSVLMMFSEASYVELPKEKKEIVKLMIWGRLLRIIWIAVMPSATTKRKRDSPRDLIGCGWLFIWRKTSKVVVSLLLTKSREWKGKGLERRVWVWGTGKER